MKNEQELVQPVQPAKHIYCQIENYGLDPLQILSSYPLERVREIHISGGSWSTPSPQYSKKTVRRDTHNGEVPEAVIDLLPEALARCPRVQAVIFERLGGTLLTELDQARFREDFARIGRVLDDFYPQTLEASKVSGVDAGVSTSTTLEPALGKSSMVSSSNREPGIILVDLRAATKTAQKIALENAKESQASRATSNRIATKRLSVYQTALMKLLGSEANPESVLEKLSKQLPDKQFSAYLQSFRPDMLEVGQELVSKWALPVARSSDANR